MSDLPKWSGVVPVWDSEIHAQDDQGIAAGFWGLFPADVRRRIIDDHGTRKYAEIEHYWALALKEAKEFGATITRQRWLSPIYKMRLENEGTPQQRLVEYWWECRFCKRRSNMNEGPNDILHKDDCHLMVGLTE